MCSCDYCAGLRMWGDCAGLRMWGDVGEEDLVNRPAHYTQGGIEAIDYIESSVKDFASYCHGNAAKYLHRHAYKGKPVEDLNKAIYYINKLKEYYEDQRLSETTSTDTDVQDSHGRGADVATRSRQRELPETD